MVSRQAAFNLLYPVKEKPVSPFDAYSAKVVKNMKSALARQDAMRFAESCLELGFTNGNCPDQHLLERGMMELKLKWPDELPKTAQTESKSDNQPNSYDKSDPGVRYAKLLVWHEKNPPGTERPYSTRKMIWNLSHADYGGLNASGGFFPFVELVSNDAVVFMGYNRILSDAREWREQQKRARSRARDNE